MSKSFTLALSLCLLAALDVPAFAQGNQDTPDGQIWIQGIAVGRLSEDWRSHIEVQPRWVDDGSELGLTIVRTAIGRQVTPRVSLWLGHVWVPRTQGEGVRHEQRIWQQLLAALPAAGGWSPTLRMRLEQRWQPDPWDGVSHRVRAMLRAQRPLRPQSRWQIAVYDEVMVTFDETPRGPLQGFDRNRVYGGIIRALSPTVAVEAGYVWEHAALAGPGSRNDHVAMGVVTLQWPRRR